MNKRFLFIAMLLILFWPSISKADYIDDDTWREPCYGWSVITFDAYGEVRTEMIKDLIEGYYSNSIVTGRIHYVKADRQDNLYLFGTSTDGQRRLLKTNKIGEYEWLLDFTGSELFTDIDGTTYAVTKNNIGKIDANGENVWSFHYNGNISTFLPIDDDGYYLIGTETTASGKTEFLYRHDKDGSLLWRNNWPVDFPFGSSGNAFISSSGDLLAVTKGDETNTILHFDKTGDLLWFYTKPNNNYIFDIVTDSQRNTIVAGYIVIEGNKTGFIGKLSPQGEEIWFRFIPSGNVESVVIDEQDQIAALVFFSSTNAIQVVKISSTGETIWTGEAGKYDESHLKKLFPLSDGSIIVAGVDFYVVHLVSFNPDGSIRWELDFDDSSFSEYFDYNVASTSKDNIILGFAYLREVQRNYNDDDDGFSNDDDDSSSGCGCAINSTDPAAPLVAVMLLIGLAAMAVSLRRK